MTDRLLWERVQEIFLEAVEKPAGERSAYVARVCGDDAKLRAEVESLLEHDSRAPADFLRPLQPPPPRPPHPPDGPDPLIGCRLGRYHIKSLIGVGGMATVYEAVQEQPRRVVALKVMKRDVAARAALRRFQLEAQVLARLRHPNVAQVYEAGVHEPGSTGKGEQGAAWAVPYFAMEYIPDARTITRYAEEERLETRERLRLFVKVCDAVHHGHQKGIIHRDLKPANILVDSAGEPKVIDFGVARATDSDLAITTQQTAVGQLIGTMQYMSPEQCQADPHDLDTRSDVYSLGVVLYELLTGELPYDLTRTPIPTAARIICEKSPPRPSVLNRKLRGDLEMITLKALEKDREKRYQSAADLGRDIQRHLDGEPIEARPATPWTRAIRWVARNPIVATTSACLSIAAIIVCATWISVWFVNARPYKIHLVQRPGCQWHTAGYEARLLSISGRILKAWRGGSDFGIRFASERLVKRPAELGGGRLALLALGDTPGNDFRGYLCAFDVDGDLEKPLWWRRVETREILPVLRTLRGMTGEEFRVHGGWVFDVFPEQKFPQHPGPEIIASFGHRTYASQQVIRIYDLSGGLLYEVWHDGAVSSCYWMRDAGLLVFAGDAHWPYHDDYGNLLEGAERFRDFVVFALRPEPGFIARRYMDYLGSEPGDERLDPAWYLRLRLHSQPRDTAEVAEWLTLRAPKPRNDPGRRVACTVHVDRQINANVDLIIDESGEEVPVPRVVTDGYKQNQNRQDEERAKLPPPEDFYFEPYDTGEVPAAGED